MSLFKVQRKDSPDSFVSVLKRRKASWVGAKLASRIVVPPALQFWYWQEFGTAVGGRAGLTDPAGGASGHTYSIYPVNAAALSWPDGQGGRTVVHYVQKHPGTRSHHFVYRSLADIKAVACAEITKAFHEGQWKYGIVKSALNNKVMPQAVEIIAVNMERSLPGTREDGKLNGSLAADFFRGLATIQDTSE